MFNWRFSGFPIPFSLKNSSKHHENSVNSENPAGFHTYHSQLIGVGEVNHSNAESSR